LDFIDPQPLLRHRLILYLHYPQLLKQQYF